jgi:hypothetical protein
MSDYAAGEAISGAIFTSTQDGLTVDANLYQQKCGPGGVWLNGGPLGPSPGLSPGDYIFQVTDPSGQQLLSSDAPKFRQVRVDASGRFAGLSGNGNHNVSNLSNPARAIIELCPFGDTPNNGGEYKVWLTRVSDFTNPGIGNCSLETGLTPGGEACQGSHGFVGGNIKTDNFKVEEFDNPPPPPPPDEQFLDISGRKFYDFDVDGIDDGAGNGEPGIFGWYINIFGPNGFTSNTSTDLDGDYLFQDLPEGIYALCEVMPELGPKWVNTTPLSISGVTIGPDSTGNNFGNVCLGAGGGHTLGFWSNKNGEKTMADGKSKIPELDLLAGLNLRKADGSEFDPGNYTAFRNWLLGAKATNMAYMLSAQLAAMKLNVEAGFVSPDANVHAGSAPADCTVDGLNAFGFISIDELMAAADAELGAHGYTPSGDPSRSCQEFLKDALDDANNNLNFVQPAGTCAVNYSGNETCIAVP